MVEINELNEFMNDLLENKIDIQENPVQQDPVQQDPVQLNPVQQDLVQQDPVQQDPVQQDPVQQDPVQQDAVQQDPVQQDPVQQNPVQQDPVQQDPVQQDIDIENYIIYNEEESYTRNITMTITEIFELSETITMESLGFGDINRDEYKKQVNNLDTYFTRVPMQNYTRNNSNNSNQNELRNSYLMKLNQGYNMSVREPEKIDMESVYVPKYYQTNLMTYQNMLNSINNYVNTSDESTTNNQYYAPSEDDSFRRNTYAIDSDIEVEIVEEDDENEDIDDDKNFKITNCIIENKNQKCPKNCLFDTKNTERYDEGYDMFEDDFLRLANNSKSRYMEDVPDISDMEISYEYDDDVFGEYDEYVKNMYNDNPQFESDSNQGSNQNANSDDDDEDEDKHKTIMKEYKRVMDNIRDYYENYEFNLEELNYDYEDILPTKEGKEILRSLIKEQRTNDYMNSFFFRDVFYDLNMEFEYDEDVFERIYEDLIKIPTTSMDEGQRNQYDLISILTWLYSFKYDINYYYYELIATFSALLESPKIGDIDQERYEEIKSKYKIEMSFFLHLTTFLFIVFHDKKLCLTKETIFKEIPHIFELI